MDSIRLFHKLLLLSSLEEFTTKMFKFMNKTDYILGEHHKAIFSAIDDVIKGRNTKLIINIAPRYGKTLLVSQMFIAYGFALNPKCKFLHLSYSGSLTQEFFWYVRPEKRPSAGMKLLEALENEIKSRGIKTFAILSVS